MERQGDGETEGRGDEEMERWRDGGMERWSAGEMGRRRDGEMDNSKKKKKREGKMRSPAKFSWGPYCRTPVPMPAPRPTKLWARCEWCQRLCRAFWLSWGNRTAGSHAFTRKTSRIDRPPTMNPAKISRRYGAIFGLICTRSRAPESAQKASRRNLFRLRPAPRSNAMWARWKCGWLTSRIFRRDK